MAANEQCARLFQEMVRRAPELGVRAFTLPNSTRVVDAGIEAPGSLEAGLMVTRITLGDEARVSVSQEEGLRFITVETRNPALATLGCQFAAWMVPVPRGVALASGPGRILARKPKFLFERLGFSEASDVAVLFLEADGLPAVEAVNAMAQACRVEPQNLHLVVAAARSLAGVVQVCSRALEDGILRLYDEGFPVEGIGRGWGRAPLVEPPASTQDPVSLLNDNLRFRGEVVCEVPWNPPEELQGWAGRAVTGGTPEAGKSFAQLMAEAKGDFRKIPIRVFSPAKFTFVETKSERRFEAGKIGSPPR